MIRIFTVNSYYSALLMATYAKQTKREEYLDILYIDNIFSEDPTFVIDLIKGTAKTYSWFDICINHRNTTYLLNKIKNNRILGKLYLLYKKNKLYKITKQIEKKTNTKVGEFNLMFGTILTGSDILIKKYPNAHIHIFNPMITPSFNEYLYRLTKINPSPQIKFYCLFADTLKSYFMDKKANPNSIYEFWDSLDKNIFKQICIKNIPKTVLPTELINHNNIILILLQNIKTIYNTPPNFYIEFLKKCIAQIKNVNDFIFVIKPHYVQEKEELILIENFFIENNYSYYIVSEKKIQQLEIETFFHLLAPQTKEVFTLFSTSLFNLSEIYSDSTLRYFYSLSFLTSYITNASLTHKNIYFNLIELFETYSFKNCKQF